MSKKKLEKRITILDPSFEEILVCNNKKLRPFIEVFVAEPENINQQRLGTLMGVFEISDEAEDSSYVANYLISVIKKEYFINPKRAPIESFEAALHKANLALSKLAEHESVHWIGKLNAIVAVVEKNNLHLSQAGTTSAFLLRSKSFTDISEGLASPELEPHPLKTFVNVSSGRLEKEDRLIITTQSIFDIFSFEEIKKSALRFNDEELIQFFKTALGNELEKAAVLVMHMREKEEIPVIVPARKSAPQNAFSAVAFRRKEPANNISAELKEEISKNKEQFTNKKSGHIYIKESEEPVTEEKAQLSEYMTPYIELPREKSKLIWKSVKEAYRQKAYGLGEKVRKISLRKPKVSISLPSPGFPKLSLPRPRINLSGLKKIFSKTIPNEETSTIDNINPKENSGLSLRSKLRGMIPASLSRTPRAKPSETYGHSLREEESESDKTSISVNREGATPSKSFFAKLADSANPEESFKISLRDKLKRWKEEWLVWIKNKRDAGISLPRAIGSRKTGKKIIFQTLPNFSRLKNIALQLNYQQKIYAALILVAIVAIPFIVMQYKNQDAEEIVIPPPVPNIEPEATEPLKNDLRVINAPSAETLPEIQGAIQLIKVNENIFARTGTNLVNIKTGKAFPLPSESGSIVSSAGMNDLSLIFLLDANGKITSFSPISEKFQSNAISIPDGSTIVSMGSYLTYIYLFDSANNQIYRYPRAEGGFGEKSNWIKGEAGVSGITQMAVNENIFLTNQKEIFKFLKGKKQDFSLEHTETSILPQAIYTSEDDTNIYILDSANARIIQASAEGNIAAQYHHPSIQGTKDLVVDKENNTAYLSDGNAVKVMKLSL